MNFFNQLSKNTKCIKLPIVIDVHGIVFIPDDLKSTIINETLELDCKYLITVNTSSGLPITKKGVPFIPIRFINSYVNNLLNNIASRSIIPEVSIINDVDYTQPDRRLKLDDYIIN
jgi:hypothetical protein